ncbi:MAG TPA: hypothetical protein VF942_04830, partial [Acidimicrobiales bacterium]
TPSSYAGKFPYVHFQTNPENMPQGGFIWDNAARHLVPTRVYGEGTYIVGISPDQLGKGSAVTAAGLLQPAVTAADVTYDPTYPNQVNVQGMVPTSTGVAVANAVYPFNDEGRVTAFRQETALFNAAGVMPNLNVMLLFDDHTDGYLPGHPSPEDHIAENDHALGEVVDTISHSKFWKDSAIFVAEDDTQSGQDHVDAHRSVLSVRVLGPFFTLPPPLNGFVAETADRDPHGRCPVSQWRSSACTARSVGLSRRGTLGRTHQFSGHRFRGNAKHLPTDRCQARGRDQYSLPGAGRRVDRTGRPG